MIIFESSVGDLFYTFPDYLMVLAPFEVLWVFVNVNKNHASCRSQNRQFDHPVAVMATSGVIAQVQEKITMSI